MSHPNPTKTYLDDGLEYCRTCREYLRINENDDIESVQSKIIHDRDCPLSLGS